MKVEKGKITIDNEEIGLDKVSIIDLTTLGGPLDKPQYCLTFQYPNGGNKTIHATSSKSRLMSFSKLNKLGKELAKTGNNNFANIGFALVNMDNVEVVQYDKQYGEVVIISCKGMCNSFKATPEQAQRTISRYKNAYQQYIQSKGLTQ